MKSKLKLLILILILLTTSIAVFSDMNSASSLSRKSNEFSTEVLSSSTTSILYLNEESDSDPLTDGTSATERLLQNPTWFQIDETKNPEKTKANWVYTFTAPLYNHTNLDEGDVSLFPTPPEVVLGNPDEDTAMLMDLIFKYREATVSIYEIDLGTSPTISEIKNIETKTLVSTVEVNTGRLQLQLGNFIDFTKTPPQYLIPYEIEILFADTSLSFVPTYHGFYSYESTPYFSHFFTNAKNLITMGNPKVEEVPEEVKPKKIDNAPVTTHNTELPLPKEFSFVDIGSNFYNGNIETKIQNYISQVQEETQLFFDAFVQRTLMDSEKNIYYQISNQSGFILFQIKELSSTGELSYELWNRNTEGSIYPQKLPDSENYLYIEKMNEYNTQIFLGYFDPDNPLNETSVARKTIQWLDGSVIVNPQNMKEEVRIASVHTGNDVYNDTVGYIAVLYHNNIPVQWLQTSDLCSTHSYLKEIFEYEVVGIDYGFSYPKACSSKFSNGVVSVHYPASAATLVIDFENCQLNLSCEYTEELKESGTSSLVSSTEDGRYSIWTLNEQVGHESFWYYYILYDNVEEKGYDFFQRIHIKKTHFTI